MNKFNRLFTTLRELHDLAHQYFIVDAHVGCALSNYGEQFSRNVLRKFLIKAITPVIANTDYEGEIKKYGDRVNVLMFLEDIALTDYTVGTDMDIQHPVDTEASLVVNNKKYYDFDIDHVDKQFTYVEDEDSTLIENASKALEKAIDQRLLSYYIEEVKAGNRVPKDDVQRDGKWTFVVGNTGTYVTITTAATYGIVTLSGLDSPERFSSSPGFGEEASFFPVNCVGRGIRICSDAANSPWYRITTRSSSTVVHFNNWNGSEVGDGRSASYVKGIWYPNGASPFYSPTTKGWGCEIEGMMSTHVTSTNIYGLICDLATALDDDDVPSENRHLSVPPWFKNLLSQASQLQPDIAIYHEAVVINGKVGRVAGFDVHMVSEDRFSTSIDPVGSGATSGYRDALTGYKILANHTGFITFAHSFAESRVIDAENQFARLYQGLNLYGFKVLPMRRKAGAYLYGYA